MGKTVRFFLEHMLDQTGYLIEASRGMTKADFLADRTLRLAFERSLEIIGEAVAKIDDDFKAAHPDIPWRKMRGMRNVVAHVYWEVDHDILWHVVQHDVPVLHEQLKAVLASL
ncbi:MAG: DUF86 domain-containing protein [Bacteroidetes bacterium]|nr:MAG: DUF86 domain-containing protein [Bacteroidota bacterium]